MICLICRQADLVDGSTSVTLEREDIKVVVNNVPARLCPICGEAIVAEEVAVRVLDAAERAADMGMNENAVEYQNG